LNNIKRVFRAFLLSVLFVILVSSSAAQDEPVVITLSYNTFLQTSFNEAAPPPIDVIREEVTKVNPNIQIELSIAPDSIEAWRDQLSITFIARNPTIDIYGIDMPWVQEFGLAGWALPLNDQLEAINDNFVSSGLDLYTFEDSLLGVPFWGSIGGLFYRTDLLEEYSFEPPETYDDIIEIANAITAENPELTGFVWNGAKEEGLIQVWVEFFRGFGGEYYDDEGGCAINSEAGQQAVQYMFDLIENGVSPAETVTWDSAQARIRFVEGNAIFLRHNSDIVTWLDDPERSNVVGNWGFMPNPAQPEGQHTGATGGFAFAVNPYTDNLTETLQVLEVIASETVQRGFALAWGPVQYYEGLYDDPEIQEANPNADAIQNVLSSAAARPASTSYAQLSSILQDELHSILTGIKSVEQGLNDACAQIDMLPS
jgi:multiple sugar transport system substrate-binding protein